jgi:hypothetical protein
MQKHRQRVLVKRTQQAPRQHGCDPGNQALGPQHVHTHPPRIALRASIKHCRHPSQKPKAPIKPATQNLKNFRPQKPIKRFPKKKQLRLSAVPARLGPKKRFFFKPQKFAASETHNGQNPSQPSKNFPKFPYKNLKD